MKQRPVPPSYSAWRGVPSLFGVLLMQAGIAGATQCYDEGFCGPGTGPCTISTTKVIDPGSQVDCTGRDLTISNAGILKIIDSEFTLVARNLTVNGPGGAILAVEGPAQQVGGVTIKLIKDNAVPGSGSLFLSGKVRSNGAHGAGSLAVEADGDINIYQNGDDGCECDGTSSGAAGGSIELHADGDIYIADPVHAAGADAGPGVAGGSVEMSAGGDISVLEDGHLAAPGRSDGGGSIRLTAGGSITLDEHADVSGHDNASAGGDIELVASGGITITQPATAHGGVGAGGDVAAGGNISVEAGCGGVVIGANMDAGSGGTSGGGGPGGSFSLEATGPVTINSGVTIDTHPVSGGDSGGPITIRSMADLVISSNARLDARGDTTTPGGNGSNILIDGCTVQVQSGAVLDASGITGGRVAINAQKQVPPSGARPLVVQTGSQTSVSGSVPEQNGSISLRTFSEQQGHCEEPEPARACWLRSDCPVGCNTVPCIGANPDTQGTSTQFSVAFTRAYVNGSNGVCASSCQ